MRSYAALVAIMFICNATPAAAERVTANLNCRAEPSTGASILERLGVGQSVHVLRHDGGWAQLDRAADCWASSRYLIDDATFAAQPSRFASAETYASERSYSAKKAKTKASKTRKYASSASSGRKARRSSGNYSSQGCPCSGSKICIGPRGGRYCITSGGNKRYGV